MLFRVQEFKTSKNTFQFFLQLQLETRTTPIDKEHKFLLPLYSLKFKDVILTLYKFEGKEPSTKEARVLIIFL